MKEQPAMDHCTLCETTVKKNKYGKAYAFCWDCKQKNAEAANEYPPCDVCGNPITSPKTREKGFTRCYMCRNAPRKCACGRYSDKTQCTTCWKAQKNVEQQEALMRDLLEDPDLFL